jgi:hypothetical protein
MEDSAARPGLPSAAPEFTEEARSRLFGRATLAGPPDMMVSKLLEMREAAGMSVEFVARSYFPTLEYPAQIELMTQLAEEVSIHV